jgi:hypothetical protein
MPVSCARRLRDFCAVFYPNPYFVYFFCKHVAFCCRSLSTSDPVHRTFSLSSWIPLGLELCSREICNEIFPDMFYGNYISHSLRLEQRNTLFNSRQEVRSTTQNSPHFAVPTETPVRCVRDCSNRREHSHALGRTDSDRSCFVAV